MTPFETIRRSSTPFLAFRTTFFHFLVEAFEKKGRTKEKRKEIASQRTNISPKFKKHFSNRFSSLEIIPLSNATISKNPSLLYIYKMLYFPRSSLFLPRREAGERAPWKNEIQASFFFETRRGALNHSRHSIPGGDRRRRRRRRRQPGEVCARVTTRSRVCLYGRLCTRIVYEGV